VLEAERDLLAFADGDGDGGEALVALDSRHEVFEFVGVRDDVVGDQQATGAEAVDEEREVVEVVGAVGIEEDQVVGAGEGGEGCERVTLDDVDVLSEVRLGEVGFGEGDLAGVAFEGGDTAGERGDGIGEPDGGVGVGGADLEDLAGVYGADEDPEELAGVRSDVEHAPRVLGLGGVMGVAGGEEAVEKLGELLVHGARQCTGTGTSVVAIIGSRVRMDGVGMADLLAEGARARLASTGAVLRALLEGMPEELVERPLDGEWSARDVVAHVISVEPLVLRARIEGMVATPGGPVPNVDEDQALADSGLRALAVGELLDRFEAGRRESLALIDGLSDAELAVSGEHELVGTMTVANMVNQFAFHDAAHIEQIVRMLAAPAEAARGGLRSFS
jgi:DinB family protein